jgi:hypothetical protein
MSEALSPATIERSITARVGTIADAVLQINSGDCPENDQACRREIHVELLGIVSDRERQREMDPFYTFPVLWIPGLGRKHLDGDFVWEDLLKVEKVVRLSLKADSPKVTRSVRGAHAEYDDRPGR